MKNIKKAAKAIFQSNLELWQAKVEVSALYEPQYSWVGVKNEDNTSTKHKFDNTEEAFSFFFKQTNAYMVATTLIDSSHEDWEWYNTINL